jgi:peptide/nickel transport system permease protein
MSSSTRASNTTEPDTDPLRRLPSAETPAQAGLPSAQQPGRGWFTLLLRRREAVAGGVIMLLMLAVALAAPWLATHEPTRLNPIERLQVPSEAHWFGTDDFGRDVYSQVIYGARTSLLVGGMVMVCSSLLGILLGLAAGYYRTLDNLLMRITDGLMAFPGIVLAIALMASLGPQVANVIIALSAVYMPRMARLIRSAVLVARELLYVEAARASGAPDRRIALKHILPNCIPPLIVQGTFIFAYAVLAEATLSFLGVGAPPYIPSWGNVISGGRLFLREAPWITLFPGIAIVVTCLGLNLFGDGLRDALDPRLRDVDAAPRS